MTPPASLLDRALATRGFDFARWLFARLLGAIFFSAFVSLGVQVRGLYGSRGIASLEWLPSAREQLGAAAYWQVPSLCWIFDSDAALVAQCIVGAAVSLVLVAGFCPGACALICWALYLSLCAVGSPFLNFQWDALLLETAFLAVFFLPWRFRPDWRETSRVSWIARLLLWWLAFRLMFESGVVKLSSGDPTWRAGTALEYHFETQPLPLWTAWFAHQSPKWLLKLSTWLMFGIELVAPWFIAGPRRCRHAAAFALVALQFAILATGNYAFFNCLTIALCLLLFEDQFWPQRWRDRCLGPPRETPDRPRQWPAWLFAPVAAAIVVITGAHLIGTFRSGLPLQSVLAAVSPLRSFNGYGLFAVMTTSRPEIIVEGSKDGLLWRSYDFKWKPGDLRRRPRLVAPHQPRLDWQMWFAALDRVERNPWLLNFLVRLLQGSPEVLALLETNPFPDQPPRYVRAVLYDYHFTRFGDGAWWKPERKGLYCPPISLRETERGRPRPQE